MKADMAYVEWDDGYLEVREASGILLVKGSNVKLEIYQREIVFKGPYEGFREYIIGRRGERKVVYLDMAFPVKGIRHHSGLKSGIIKTTRDLSVGSFGLSYTKLDDLGSYITIYPPPGFMFDQIVISQYRIAVFTLGRRRIYMMEDSGLKRLIMV